MKLFRTLFVAGMVQVAALSAAHAQSGLDQIKSAGVLKFGTEGTYAPFTFHEASGQLVGFDVDIGRAIAQRLGVKAEFVEGKWDGLIAGLTPSATTRSSTASASPTRAKPNTISRIRTSRPPRC